MSESRTLRASIVILAWNEWAATKACLESLRPTLRRDDQVIVVDNGSVDETPRRLRAYPWVEVVTNEENQGFARGCNQGAAVSTGDVLVFLNNDTVPTAHWLDALLAPFADPQVGATGPRSNFVSGPQLVTDGGYDVATRRGLREFARTWRERHKGMTTSFERLVGFCLAVRTDVFAEVGGFDEGYGIGGYEDDDLCACIGDAGYDLRIVHDSFVHHDGHRSFTANDVDWFAIQQANEAHFLERHGHRPWTPPFVSACLIVKDEEVLLPGCLESLEGVADEVVVYDTGSSDATRELARAAGAVVIDGYWDDDFGRARNDALVHCTGEWVLWVDADERIDGDTAALVTRLREPSPDVWYLRIENLGDDGRVEMEHRALRLFRRVRAQWAGRLHEQIVPRPGQPMLTSNPADDVWISHLGYQSDVIATKDKAARNVRIAEKGLTETTGSGRDTDRVTRLANLARSLVGAGQPEEALARCEEGRYLGGLPASRCTLLRQGAELLIALGRAAEALPWVDDLRLVSTTSDVCDFLEGSAHLQLGDAARAAELLGGLDEVWDDSGQGAAPDILIGRRSLALVVSGRADEALDGLLGVLTRAPETPVWQPLFAAAVSAERRIDDVAAAVPEAQLRTVLAQLLTGGVEVADQGGEALWRRFPDHRMAAYGVHLGPALNVERALEWSARCRHYGLEEQCPLIARTERRDAPADERLRAAAVALAAFGDERAVEASRRAARALPPDQFTVALLELDELAPTLLPVVVAAAATTPLRTNAMADALAALGALEQADLLRETVPA